MCPFLNTVVEHWVNMNHEVPAEWLWIIMIIPHIMTWIHGSGYGNCLIWVKAAKLSVKYLNTKMSNLKICLNLLIWQRQSLCPSSVSVLYVSICVSSLCLCLQVSAEPDGSSYVFQGFIQGKDYGQFGLQRLGNYHWHVSCTSLWIIRDMCKTLVRRLQETHCWREGPGSLFLLAAVTLLSQPCRGYMQREQNLLFRPEAILKWLNSINLHPQTAHISVKQSWKPLQLPLPSILQVPGHLRLS